MKQTRQWVPLQSSSTARMAHSLLGKESPYIWLGDSFEKIIGSEELDLSVPYLQSVPFLGMVTILEYLEGMQDSQAINALRERVEWKYALHLPAVHAGIEQRALCQFRQQIVCSAETAQQFAGFVGRFQREKGVMFFGMQLDGKSVCLRVCQHNRLGKVIAAFTQTLTSLAYVDPAWLLRSSLPYWYTRYSSPKDSSEYSPLWKEEMQAVGQDIAYLLQKMEVDPPAGDIFPEAETLRLTFADQFLTDHGADNTISVRPFCSLCRAAQLGFVTDER